MKHALSLVAAVGIVATLPTPASAAQLLYSLTPLGQSGYRASWLMDVNPTPTQVVTGQGFALERVIGTFPRATDGDAYLDFFFATSGGGLVISDADGPRTLATLFGPQLYSGSEAAPTMLAGAFTLTANQNGGRRYLLNVVNAAVPEPTTWLLMIGGFAMVGAALRHRRRVTVRYA